MITLLNLLAGLVAVATGMAMLHDSDFRPADRSSRGWFRHVARLLLLIGITAAGGVLILVPAARSASLYASVFQLALACLLAMQSPCPWWRYVLCGRDATWRVQ